MLEIMQRDLLQHRIFVKCHLLWRKAILIIYQKCCDWLLHTFYTAVKTPSKEHTEYTDWTNLKLLSRQEEIDHAEE